MKNLVFRHIGLLVALTVMSQSCIEEIDVVEDLSFEDAIVIEATISDEMKQHVVYISRSFSFEEESASPETNSQVSVTAGESTINFTEETPGIYVSNEAFSAKSGIDYRLFVTTSSGNSYTTLPVQLPVETEIDRVYASREINSIGNEIMAIKVDSYDMSRESNYYRYEYEETYKIVAPNWVRPEFIILEDEEGNELPAPGFTVRSSDEKVCYNTVLSNSIIQTSTTNLDEDRVTGFAVRTISREDPIISHRYSILVKQYVQSLEAYSYYYTLDQLTGSGNALSQIQPGFINSNIISTDDREEKVLGFFDVATVSEERFFFNYEDFFPGERLPPYFVSCGFSAPPIVTEGGTTPLKDAIQAGNVKFLRENLDPGRGEGPYDVVPRACGDCTALGTTEEPDFWEE